MALRLFLLFTVVSVAQIAGHATQSPAEVYWKTKLGNIPMPKVVKDGLQPGLDASITTGYAQELPTMSNKNYQLNDVFIGYGHEHRLPTTKNYKLNDVFIGYGHKHSTLSTEKNYKLNDVFIGYGHEHRLPTEKNYQLNDVFIGYAHRPPPKTVETLNAKHTIDEGLLDDNSIIFFSEKDLIYPRGVMKLQFISSNDGIKFLPLEVAKSIPFSSEKLSKLLNLLSVKPESTNAKIMEDTIRMCEAGAINGEDKHCTTSLEDMVDYAISKAGNNVMAYSTEVDKDTTIMEYYRVKGAQKISKDVNLVCHKMSYPYAVFYCHSQKRTDTYIVSLVGSNGKKTKAVAVCHKDTSSWDPSHLAFQLLKVKPGSMPICHFLNDITMVWVPK